MTYAEMVHEIKGRVDTSKMGVKIKKAMKTKEGDLKIIVHSKEGAQRLKEEIEQQKEKKYEIGIKSIGREKTIIITDLDETTTKEDIRIAIKETGIEIKEDKIEDIRRNRMDKYTTSIRVAKTEAEGLIKRKKMKIGWSNGRIIEKIEPLRCNNCLRFGHKRIECEETRTEGRKCLKCREEGHTAKECSKTKKICTECGQEGHWSESMKCEKYREEVKKERNRLREKRRQKKEQEGRREEPERESRRQEEKRKEAGTDRQRRETDKGEDK